MRAAQLSGQAFDASQILSEDCLSEAKRRGYVAGWRYVPLPGNSPRNDCHPDELAAFGKAGLGLGLIQHVRLPDWSPDEHAGSDDGRCAAVYAQAIGYPAGAHLWLDLEGIRPGTSDESCLRFANYWSSEVVARGYRAGLYVGYDVPLTPDQLFHRLRWINSYWTDAGNRHVSVRGCAVRQGQAGQLIHAQIDDDTIALDLRGELPYFAVAD